MFTYEYDQTTGMAIAKEDGYAVAQLDINYDLFEQIGGDEMSDGEIEMHCEEMEKEAERFFRYAHEMKGEDQYNGRF